jgi:transcription termination factor Rho
MATSRTQAALRIWPPCRAWPRKYQAGGATISTWNGTDALNLADLDRIRAGKIGAQFEGAPNRKQLLTQVFAAASAGKRADPARRGWIDINAQGAFVVHKHVNYRLYPDDAYLPESLVARYGLKRGHQVEVAGPGARRSGERCPVGRSRRFRDGRLNPQAISERHRRSRNSCPYYPLEAASCSRLRKSIRRTSPCAPSTSSRRSALASAG